MIDDLNPGSNRLEELPSVNDLDMSTQFYVTTTEQVIDKLSEQEAKHMCKYYLRHNLNMKEGYNKLLKEYMLPNRS